MTQGKMGAKFAAFNERWETDQAALLAEHAVFCEHCGQPRPRAPIEFEGMVIMLGQPGVCPCDKAQAAQSKEECQEHAARMAAARVAAGLNGRLATHTFDSYSLTKPDGSPSPDKAHRERQLDAARAYADGLISRELGAKRWRIFHGAYGLGKSHLAAAVMNAVLEYGWDRVYFRVWPEYLSRLKATFDRDSMERTATVETELKRARLLVLDDVDKAKPTDWTHEILYTALDSRYNRGRPTIITTNAAPKDLEPWVGKALLDRMAEMSKAIPFKGTSYRSGIRW